MQTRFCVVLLRASFATTGERWIACMQATVTVLALGAGSPVGRANCPVPRLLSYKRWRTKVLATLPPCEGLVHEGDAWTDAQSG